MTNTIDAARPGRLKRTPSMVMATPVDWLLALVISWILPLEILGFRSTYLSSLVFWVVPIVLLLPRLYYETDAGGRRRRAFWLATSFILAAGTLLDFILGSWVLRFDCDDRTYLWRFPFGQRIPIEEVLFYLLGGMAIVLVYFWADEYWLKAYNRRQRRNNADLGLTQEFRLLRFSGEALLYAGIFFGIGLGLTWHFQRRLWPPPIYFTFLIVIAYAPAVAIYRGVKDVVNWQAFSFTCLYVLATSSIWEVTLGIARKWWWYQESPAVIGWHVNPFGALPGRPYPIEALLVWFAVSFDAILAYEFFKGITHEPRGLRRALWGEPKEAP